MPVSVGKPQRIYGERDIPAVSFRAGINLSIYTFIKYYWTELSPDNHQENTPV